MIRMPKTCGAVCSRRDLLRVGGLGLGGLGLASLLRAAESRRVEPTARSPATTSPRIHARSPAATHASRTRSAGTGCQLSPRGPSQSGPRRDPPATGGNPPGWGRAGMGGWARTA